MALLILGIAHGSNIHLAQNGVFVLDFGKVIYEWHDRHRRRPHLGRFGDRHHRHVSAVAAARDHQLSGIEIAGLFDPVGGRQHILQVASTHVEQVSLLKFFAITG